MIEMFLIHAFIMRTFDIDGYLVWEGAHGRDPFPIFFMGSEVRSLRYSFIALAEKIEQSKNIYSVGMDETSFCHRFEGCSLHVCR